MKHDEVFHAKHSAFVNVDWTVLAKLEGLSVAIFRFLEKTGDLSAGFNLFIRIMPLHAF